MNREKDVRKEFSDVIYPTMVIRSQAETIELQDKEIEKLNNIIKNLENYLLEIGVPRDYLRELKEGK